MREKKARVYIRLQADPKKQQVLNNKKEKNISKFFARSYIIIGDEKKKGSKQMSCTDSTPKTLYYNKPIAQSVNAVGKSQIAGVACGLAHAGHSVPGRLESDAKRTKGSLSRPCGLLGTTENILLGYPEAQPEAQTFHGLYGTHHVYRRLRAFQGEGDKTARSWIFPGHSWGVSLFLFISLTLRRGSPRHRRGMVMA